MTNELATQVEPTDRALAQLMRQAQAMSAAHQLGSALAATDMVPDMYKNKPDNATAAILYGAELGMSAIQSLQNVFIVRGKPAVYARVMAAQVLAAGHTLREESASAESVTWTGRRADTGAEFTSTWSLERAKLAGYTSNKLYTSNPIEMLRAKAISELCRAMAPDVLLGLAYSREDLEMEPVQVISERTERPSAAAILAKQAEPESVPMITPSQLKKLHATFGDVGLSNRAEGLAWISDVLGREVTSSKQVTRDEATLLFEKLDDAGEPEAPEPDPAQMTLEGE